MTVETIDQAETSIDLRVINYPHTGNDAVGRVVLFGPTSPNIAVLIEVDPEAGDVPSITYTIGNGPPNEELAESVSVMLYEMADLLRDAGKHPEFLEAVADASAPFGNVDGYDDPDDHGE